jgi:hypothetical protein
MVANTPAQGRPRDPLQAAEYKGFRGIQGFLDCLRKWLGSWPICDAYSWDDTGEYAVPELSG